MGLAKVNPMPTPFLRNNISHESVISQVAGYLVDFYVIDVLCCAQL